MLKLLVQTIGLFIFVGSVIGVLFFGQLAGLSSNVTILSMLGAMLISLGVFGPLLLLGLHCMIFRWNRPI